jgi:kynurenine formamidase
MFKLISYPITSNVPAWPGSPQTVITKHNDISKGDAANTCVISIYDHIGTHYDAPNHFIENGLRIAELPLSRFIFNSPLLLDIPKSFCQKITRSDLEPHASEISRADLLMLRTGFSKYREREGERYGREGPAIASEAAQYLADNFPNLAAVAVDFVSVGSFSGNDDGRLTHRALLGAEHFICAIEDVNMSIVDPDKLVRVFALPLFVEGSDSSPVTMLAQEG